MNRLNIKIVSIMIMFIVLSGCGTENGTGRQKGLSEGVKNTGSGENFRLFLEAEDIAVTTGNVRVENSHPGFSGNGYLTGIEDDDDTITFTVFIPEDGFYNLNFISSAYGGYKENYVYINDEQVGVIKINGDDFQNSVLNGVFLPKGRQKIKLVKSWGWIRLDALEITSASPPGDDVYKVSYETVDPKATKSTKRLKRYLADVYGKYIISGQYSEKGFNGPEFKAIYQATGKYPAMLGLDFIDYTPSRAAYGSVGKSVEYAVEFSQKGGIVTFCWHWNAPERYLYNTPDKPWWKGFYTEATNIDLRAIMDGEDPEGYELLIRDIDVIAQLLMRLQDADVPVLWRPLHEASGGWFWWGASGPEPYKKLYKLLYDRLTNTHDIHNLIWVWNGQDPEWYPGDEYVDIVGIDIYPGEKVYSSQAPKFNEILEWTGTRKIIAMTENGCLFDPDLAFRDRTVWSYFGIWSGEFMVLNKTYTLSEKYNEKYMINKVYNHEKVITLDELPDLKKYRGK
ncbi:mannan endo-1,4-beta-mannosidase ManA [Thermoclostridium stercorarium subsp. stercorarium DSM 8532]|uniref:Mannan endo-1,4-beta-mannosidase ManA n=2 Tax=Thermoclostridium stercorarium TaxID=1510 RepID=L7VJA2_THES1|nr:glycosyl hydrolase [Thermoclostridium stercorarium]AGC68130.1 mannan endo-1,4-beta-mannosidase ManA [Thermoclostridium stercorarium subsp. stercorarium DSM 8532]AGI39156.1 xylanase [Thermoclostridium stercorarium subsp. stercorarium DSM 8532]ANW98509.1 beta-mannosidase [Thermoclostridium stercorarium subsp. thermolacticum DSM 2910]UZQ86657.1 glycosyl hydrolase [Thermoclostridium stercorarium]